MSENFCGSCRHYKRLPRQRDASGAIDMSVPQAGQCRQGPPHVTILPQPNGQTYLFDYPPLPPTYKACDQFEAEGEHVMETRRSGLPLVAGEAICSGAPVVIAEDGTVRLARV